MRRDTISLKGINSSFLSCEKDIETILRKLFVESYPYSKELKKLLVINTKDCLDLEEDNEIVQEVGEMSLQKLRKEGYIKLEPKVRFPEHEEIKTYIIMSFDNFATTKTNPQFRDCTVTFDILCHTDYWDIGNYRLRPLKIAGYIDGILDNCKLSGIGTFQFMGCNELVINENLSGYSLMYSAVHGSDDRIPPAE